MGLFDFLKKAPTLEELPSEIRDVLLKVIEGLLLSIPENNRERILYNHKIHYIKVELIHKVSYEEADKYIEDYNNSGEYPEIYLERYDRLDNMLWIKLGNKK